MREYDLKVVLQASRQLWVAAGAKLVLRPRNTTLLRLPVDSEEAKKLRNLWLTSGDPRTHAIETPAQCIGGGQIALLDGELEELMFALKWTTLSLVRLAISIASCQSTDALLDFLQALRFHRGERGIAHESRRHLILQQVYPPLRAPAARL
jgi:hypothetical protein